MLPCLKLQYTSLFGTGNIRMPYLQDCWETDPLFKVLYARQTMFTPHFIT
jgi:hypothetical protein